MRCGLLTKEKSAPNEADANQLTTTRVCVPERQKARIPDVCDCFGFSCIKVIDILEEQGAVL
jgi:hypothetical protein